MRQGWRAGLWWRQRKNVERVLQDRLHAPIATGLGEDGSFGSGFHALRRVLLRQANDAETGTVAHFRVGLFIEIRSNNCAVCGPMLRAQFTMREGGHSRWA